MTSTFPDSYDSFSTKVDNVTRIIADHVNKLQDCVTNIETELGLSSKGDQTNLTDRLHISLDEYGYNVDYFYNKEGSTLMPGQVTVFDSTNNNSVKLNSVANETGVVGVVTTMTAIDELTPIKTKGNIPVYMIADGSDISPGDLLTTSSYPGFVTKASGTTAVIGRSNISLTAGSSGIYSINIGFTDNLLMDHTHDSTLSDDGGALGDDVVDSRILNDSDSNYKMAGLVISGNLSISGDLIVLGDEIVSSTEVVSGNKAIFSNMDVNGDSYLGNEFSDITYIQGNFYVANENSDEVDSNAYINIGKKNSIWAYISYTYGDEKFEFSNSVDIIGILTSQSISTYSASISGALITQSLETSGASILDELNMNNNKIINVATSELSGDAANKYYVDTISQQILEQSESYTNEASSNLINYINENASGTLEQTLTKGNSAGSYEIDMNNNKIINVTTPESSGDVANKFYVDSVISEIASGGSGGGVGITWNEITDTSQTASSNNGYIANNSSQVNITLPSSCAIGSLIAIVGKGSGGWKISQNAGQTIHFINIDTTTGTSGYVQSTEQYDSLELVCITANTDFVVRNSVGTMEMN